MDLCNFTKKAITKYNQTPHSSPRMFAAAPEEARNAFDFNNFSEKSYKQKQTHPTELITQDNNESKAIEFSEYKAQVFEKYSGDWEKFFIDWRNTQNDQFGNLVEQNKYLVIQHERQFEQTLKLERQLSYLEKREIEREHREKQKAILREKRIKQKKQKKRDYV
jgi:hypothetical protein